jgi:hypothetical protein
LEGGFAKVEEKEKKWMDFLALYLSHLKRAGAIRRIAKL